MLDFRKDQLLAMLVVDDSLGSIPSKGSTEAPEQA